MDPDDFSIDFKKVHFRTVLLRYEDAEGVSEAHLEQSSVPEYDWIGAEPDLDAKGERLEKILSRIQMWAKDNDLRIKIWPEDQLGI